MLKIERTRAVEVFKNRYGSLYNDEVRGPTGAEGRYLRWAWSSAGVVVVPRREGLVALAFMQRYPIARASLELPRGGVEQGETLERAALRELREEFGLTGADVGVRGEVFADTGLIETPLHVVTVAVTERVPPTVEAMESIEVVQWLDRAALHAAIARGEIRCAVTLAALVLVEAL